MKKIITLTILGVLIVALIILSVYRIAFIGDEPIANQPRIIDTIEGFGYTLEDRDTPVFAEEFANLRAILTAAEIDYDAYALSLAKLFVIDFYTLTNKESSSDVGGLEFIDPRIVDNFRLKAMDTIYKYLKNNFDNNRTQILPEVRSILSAMLEHTTYEINGEEVAAIKVIITWDFVTDLGYDNNAEIIFIRDGKRLILVDFQGSNSSGR